MSGLADGRWKDGGRGAVGGDEPTPDRTGHDITKFLKGYEAILVGVSLFHHVCQHLLIGFCPGARKSILQFLL